jgi:hypothetical protein
LIKIVEGQPCVQLAEEGGNYSSVPLTDELLLNPPGNIVVRQCYRNKGIDEALPGPELEAARKTARRQLASAARRRRRVWEVAGLPAASGNVAATSAEAQHAQVELALVIPETAAGAMAVITYWCDHANVHLQGALYNESEFMMRLLTSLHATFGSLRKLRSM